MCILFCATNTLADDVLNENEEYISMEDFDLGESTKALEKNGYKDLNIKNMLDEIMEGNVLDVIKQCGSVIYDKTIGDISTVEKLLGNLLLIVILSAFFTNFTNVFSNEYFIHRILYMLPFGHYPAFDII